MAQFLLVRRLSRYESILDHLRILDVSIAQLRLLDFGSATTLRSRDSWSSSEPRLVTLEAKGIGEANKSDPGCI